MDEREKYAVPGPGKVDMAYTLVKAGVSTIPVVGGAAAELFALVVTPPLDKRRGEWMSSIAEGLKSLEGKVEGFRVENLPMNEAFISTVMHASQAAIRNHEREKIEALRDAVLNVAIGNAPDEDVQLVFVSLVDAMTRWHMRILQFFQNPGTYIQYDVLRFNSGSPSQLLETQYPDLRKEHDFCNLVVRDLHAHGLFSSDSVQGMTTGPGMFAKRTTDFGDRFLAFVKSPL